MNRRRLLGLLGIGGLGTLIPNINATTKSDVTADKFSYKDFDIHWTGWKTSQDSDRIAGQWVAHSRIKLYGEFGYDYVNIHSNAPNKYGANQYRLGTVFCIAGVLHLASSDIEKECEKSGALHILLREINRLYQKQDYYKNRNDQEPEFKFSFSGFKK